MFFICNNLSSVSSPGCFGWTTKGIPQNPFGWMSSGCVEGSLWFMTPPTILTMTFGWQLLWYVDESKSTAVFPVCRLCFQILEQVQSKWKWLSKALFKSEVAGSCFFHCRMTTIMVKTTTVNSFSVDKSILIPRIFTVRVVDELLLTTYPCPRNSSRFGASDVTSTKLRTYNVPGHQENWMVIP